MFKKPVRKIHTVFIHCSDSDAPGIDFIGKNLEATIHRWHTDPKRPGGTFAKIGYHFVIDKAGAVIPTRRGLEETPAGQAGYNTGTICICVHGRDIKLFTDRQRLALYNLCKEINTAYNGSMMFRGHREVNKGKSCPVFDYTSWLGLDQFKHMKT